MKTKIESVDEYISTFPKNVREILEKIRSLIKKKAPDVVEGMSYGLPDYKTHGKPLVYFAGYDKHIGFYATPTGHREFSEELSKFKQGKGSVQFPLGKPIPYDLITRIVEFRVEENSIKRK